MLPWQTKQWGKTITNNALGEQRERIKLLQNYNFK